MKTHTISPAESGPRYLRAKALAQRLDISVATLWRWAQSGRLPRPHKLSPGVTAWNAHEVEQALREREERVAG